MGTDKIACSPIKIVLFCVYLLDYGSDTILYNYILAFCLIATLLPTGFAEKAEIHEDVTAGLKDVENTESSITNTGTYLTRLWAMVKYEIKNGMAALPYRFFLSHFPERD